MDDQQRQFVRNLLHQFLHSAIHAVMWRMPTMLLLLLIAGAAAAIWYFRLY